MNRLLSQKEVQILAKAEEFVRKLMTADTTGHDFFHVQRVVASAKFILKKTVADPFIVLLAAWLHDLDDDKIAAENSQLAKDFLQREQVDKDIRIKIIQIIDTISYRHQAKGILPDTIEAMIVQDADRLDAIGAIGIARAFAYGGSKHRPIFQGKVDDASSIAHFYQKLLKLSGLMNTIPAKKMAKKYTKEMERFLRMFHKQWTMGGI